jgi:hypothetical protein
MQGGPSSGGGHPDYGAVLNALTVLVRALLALAVVN